METDELIRCARAYALLRKQSDCWQIDASGYWSYPAIVLNKRNDPQWLCLVLSCVEMREENRTALFRPKAIVISKAGTNHIVRFEDFRSGHDPFPAQGWDTPIAMYPHKSIGDLSHKDFSIKQGELLKMYPQAQSHFLKTGSLPVAFTREYLQLLHPIFLPYIKHLAPKFFAALDVEETAGKA